MINLALFMSFVYLSGIGVSFILDGSTGPAATELTVAASTTATILTVHSTGNFLADDFLVIGDEQICYTGKTTTVFSGLTRGCNNTSIKAHSAGTRVFNEPAGMMNLLIGFDLIQTLTEGNVIIGMFRAAWQLPGVVQHVFTKLVLWDFAYLEGNAVYMKYYFLYPISFAFAMSLFILAWKR